MEALAANDLWFFYSADYCERLLRMVAIFFSRFNSGLTRQTPAGALQSVCSSTVAETLEQRK